MKKFLKTFLLGKGIQKRRILFGIARGIKMNISTEHKSQRFLGLEENEIQTSFKKFARSASVFVDIGASDGYYGLIYYKLNKNGNQYLFDADINYAQLQHDHYLMNNFATDKVNFISKFVAEVNDDKHISLDSLLNDTQGTIFFKIDVDGGELEVLKGAENILKKKNCKLILETHSKELEENCIVFLNQIGYSTTIIPNAWWRVVIPELRPIAHNRWFSAEKK